MANTSLPIGWVALDPNDELRRCANWSSKRWQVAIDRGSIKIVEAPVREPNTKPALPFGLTMALRGRHHVLPVADGFLVGCDGGEWGGSLHAFSTDGKQHTRLADDNVRGLVAFGDEVVSIEGVSHLGLSEGNARWLRREGGAWHEVALVPLDAGPQTFVASADAIYVLTRESLVHIGRDHTATTIQPVRNAGLYPDSMSVDAADQLWIGMRLFILRLTPNGNGYDETWLVPEGCEHARLDEENFDCVCDG